MKNFIFVAFAIGLTVSVFAQKNIYQIKSDIEFKKDPVKVVEILFNEIKTGDFIHTPDLCDPYGLGDGDTKRMCDLIYADEETKAMYRKYFYNAKVTGSPVYDNESGTCKVPIVFGENNEENEEIKLIKYGEYWYLSSF